LVLLESIALKIGISYGCKKPNKIAQTLVNCIDKQKINRRRKEMPARESCACSLSQNSMKNCMRGYYRRIERKVVLGSHTGSLSLGRFRNEVGRIWFGVLRRCSQKFRRRRWQYMARLIRYWLPPARILHPYPNERLVVT
jgi:hypothetical protein